MTFWGMSAEKAWRRRSWGVGISGAGSSNIGERASDSSDGCARRRASGVARWIDSLAGETGSSTAGSRGAAGSGAAACGVGAGASG